MEFMLRAKVVWREVQFDLLRCRKNAAKVRLCSYRPTTGLHPVCKQFVGVHGKSKQQRASPEIGAVLGIADVRLHVLIELPQVGR